MDSYLAVFSYDPIGGYLKVDLTLLLTFPVSVYKRGTFILVEDRCRLGEPAHIMDPENLRFRVWNRLECLWRKYLSSYTRFWGVSVFDEAINPPGRVGW